MYQSQPQAVAMDAHDLKDRAIFTAFKQEFIVDKRYTVQKEMGKGAYGIVCAAMNTQTGEGVAIKKVTNVFSKQILAKRALREIKLLQHFRGHRNITCLYDMDIPGVVDREKVDPVTIMKFNEAYLYEELMECDLSAIIKSNQPLTDAHFQSFIYQILCGLKYIHSADVLHRDLKPANLLVNADCELKICDFGLARGFSNDPETNAGYMTEYVATRWYRAPEIMLSFQGYTKAIDVWSVGCILAELLHGEPFFQGKGYAHQLEVIFNIIGTPNEEQIRRISSSRAQEYVRSLPPVQKRDIRTLFPRYNREMRYDPISNPSAEVPEALRLLDAMLNFDPEKRITVEAALQHPYLKVWHDPYDEPSCPTKFDFSFEAVQDVPEMRHMIVKEVQRFRDHVRQSFPNAAGAQGGAQGGQQVPIPSEEEAKQWAAQNTEPKPEEAAMTGYNGHDMGLEESLHRGLDMRYY